MGKATPPSSHWRRPGIQRVFFGIFLVFCCAYALIQSPLLWFSDRMCNWDWLREFSTRRPSWKNGLDAKSYKAPIDWQPFQFSFSWKGIVKLWEVEMRVAQRSYSSVGMKNITGVKMQRTSNLNQLKKRKKISLRINFLIICRKTLAFVARKIMPRWMGESPIERGKFHFDCKDDRLL